MNYRDIIREMKSSGHYLEADELENSMRDNMISDYYHVYRRTDARDGLDMGSYAGDLAERAYEEIKRDERREEERREEEEEQHRQYLHHQQQMQQEEETPVP